MPEQESTTKRLRAAEQRMKKQDLLPAYKEQLKAELGKGLDYSAALRSAEKALNKAADKPSAPDAVCWLWVLNNLSVANVDMEQAPAAWAFTALLAARKNPQFAEQILLQHLKITTNKAAKQGADRFSDDGRDIIDLCSQVQQAFEENPDDS